MIANAHRILWLPGEDSRNWDYESGGWASSNRNPSGVKVDAETALRSTTVLACMRVLSTSVAGLPLHIYRRLRDGGKEIAREHPLYRLLHTTPNGWQTSVEWREQLMLHMLSYGQAFNEKVYSGGQIAEIVPLHPSRMKTEQLENNRLRYAYREAQGTSTVYTQDAIMHVRGMSDDGVNGMSMIELARDAIGLARACEIHGATFFGNGARPGVILSTDQMLSPEAAENTRNQWERAHRGPDRSNRTAVLQGGLKVNELGGNNQESQFLEARRFQVEEVCRVFGVPPHLVGDLTRSSFSNIEQQSLDYLQNGLMPWLRRIESAIARDLLDGDDEYFAEFDTRGVLRADAAGRAAYYNTLWNLGVASVNEIRSWENMNPVEGGDTRFVQLNMTTLDKAAAEPEVPATVVEEVVVDETALAPEPVAEEPQLAEASLNGAQITGILEILTQVSGGLLTTDAAGALILASFPSIPPAAVDRILAGTSTQPVAPEPVAEPPATEPLAASLPASRAMTISVDFDRTFAADPRLWGEFARQSAAAGNRVVMVSRRPDTPENQAEIAETLGDYREAFDAVLLVGDRLKDEAAREAGIAVDVWVDDSPQFVRAAESRAEPGSVAEGDFVSWDSSGGRARGRIDHVMDYGTLDIPGTDFKIDATEEDPAALITVYEEVSGGWRPTETQVGHKVATLTKIDRLPEPPAKPARRLLPVAKRDCGTGAGGFKPGNKCAGEGGGGDSGSSEGGGGSGGESVGSADGQVTPNDRQRVFRGASEKSMQPESGGDPEQIKERAVFKKQVEKQILDRLRTHSSEDDVSDELLQAMRFDKPEYSDGASPGEERRTALARGMVDQWASTSGDTDPPAVAVQRAIASELAYDVPEVKDAEFGHLGQYGRLRMPPENIMKARQTEKLVSESDAVRQVSRAQYDATQQYFRDQGITEVTLHRGFMAPNLKESDDAEFRLQPASSFSLNRETAVAFADGLKASYAGVATVTVPVSRILSTPMTGFGCLSEQEVVVVGGRIRGKLKTGGKK